ncbi:MAG: hypothetical protein RLZZ502_206 [Pseudomonadota bacterium]|jgi:hypothetical protein
MEVINDCLKQFRDVPDVTKWPEVSFLQAHEPGLHQVFISDLNEAQMALAAGNWKSATVVAASVMEALLHWWLGKQASLKVEKNLQAMIESAVNHNLFMPSTSTISNFDKTEAEGKKGAAICAANYRNLIHADKSKRLATTCSRASAWQVFGATLMVADAIGRKLTASP